MTLISAVMRSFVGGLTSRPKHNKAIHTHHVKKGFYAIKIDLALSSSTAEDKERELERQTRGDLFSRYDKCPALRKLSCFRELLGLFRLRKKYSFFRFVFLHVFNFQSQNVPIIFRAHKFPVENKNQSISEWGFPPLVPLLCYSEVPTQTIPSAFPFSFFGRK